VFKSVDYAVIFALTPVVLDQTFSFLGYEFSVITMIAFLLF
jgi:hypothetical protein